MAFSATCVFEVRPSGNDANGGLFNPAATGSPTDYSQQDAPALSLTDLAMTGTGVIATTASEDLMALMKGNGLYITGGTNFVVGRYEIKAIDDNNGLITLDRNATNGSNASAGTCNIGGGLATLKEAISAAGAVAGNTIWVAGGVGVSYTALAAWTAATAGTRGAKITVRGYSGTRGVPAWASRPTIAMGAYALTTAAFFDWFDVQFSGTAAQAIIITNPNTFVRCSGVHTSTTANRILFYCNYAQAIGTCFYDCEGQNKAGVAFGLYRGCYMNGCYVYDSNIGITNIHNLALGSTVEDCVIDSCVYGIDSNNYGGTCAPCMHITGCTIRNCVYGIYAVEPSGGLGIGWGSSVINCTITSCLYGFYSTVADSIYTNYNNFYNNSTDRTNITAGTNDLAVNPAFVSTALTGTDGTTNAAPGTTFTSASSNFSSLTTSDMLVIKTAAGGTIGLYAISAVAPGGDNTKLTLATSPGNSLTFMYFGIIAGNDNSIGTSSPLKGAGRPITLGLGSVASAPDVGAYQNPSSGQGAVFGSDIILRS